MQFYIPFSIMNDPSIQSFYHYFINSVAVDQLVSVADPGFFKGGFHMQDFLKGGCTSMIFQRGFHFGSL